MMVNLIVHAHFYYSDPMISDPNDKSLDNLSSNVLFHNFNTFLLFCGFPLFR